MPKDGNRRSAKKTGDQRSTDHSPLPAKRTSTLAMRPKTNQIDANGSRLRCMGNSPGDENGVQRLSPSSSKGKKPLCRAKCTRLLLRPRRAVQLWVIVIARRRGFASGALRAISNFPFDLVSLCRGSVSFFDRVGFAQVFALFCFAIKPGPFFVINVRVRVNPHEAVSSARCGRRVSRCLSPSARCRGWVRGCWTG